MNHATFSQGQPPAQPSAPAQILPQGYPFGRRRRLAGVVSLFDLALRACARRARGPRLPGSARLRRDIGLPEVEDVPAARAQLRRRT